MGRQFSMAQFDLNVNAIADPMETALRRTILADRKCTWQIRGVHSRSLLLHEYFGAVAVPTYPRSGAPGLILV